MCNKNFSAVELQAANLSGPALIRTLEYRDLLAFGFAYIAPVAPLSTFGFVWNASGGLVALAYLLGALSMYFTAKSYAEMTEVMPSAGSVFGIARYCLGELPGFIAGWQILLDYLLIPSLIFVLMSVGMNSLVPQIDRAAWIIIVVTCTLAINWHGVTVTSRANMLSVLAQFCVILVIVALGIGAIYSDKSVGGFTLRPFYSADLFSLNRVFAATSICVFSFLGFDAISTLAEEVKGEDRKIVGKAITNVLLYSGVLFVLTAWTLGDLMPGLNIKDPAMAIFELTSARFSARFSVLLAWLLVFIVGFTNALPTQIGVARVLFAMGREGQLPAVFAILHIRHGTPYVAMLFSTIVSFIVALAMRNRLDMLASFVNFGALTAFLLLHLSVLVHMAWGKHSKRYFAHWCVPFLGIGIILAILLNMASSVLIVGLCWLVLGMSYRLFTHRRQRTDHASKR